MEDRQKANKASKDCLYESSVILAFIAMCIVPPFHTAF